MSALRIVVTSAGVEALVNAQNTGTNAVLIAQVGLTAQGFSADFAMTSLPGEFKRLATFAGAVVDADTIHLTIRDESADVYSLRGFGLYLGDGTLFALYGQNDVILEKSPQSMLLLATDIRFTRIDAASLAFGDSNWINPPATTEVVGVVELATSDEANTGLDAARTVTPSGLKFTLDQRLGGNAPSPFMKNLLRQETAPLARGRLELKSAALKDEGAGNGLDADTLDGEHGAFYRAWGNLTGKPAAFIPEIAGLPELTEVIDGIADIVPIYDASSGSVKKISVGEIMSLSDARVRAGKSFQYSLNFGTGNLQLSNPAGSGKKLVITRLLVTNAQASSRLDLTAGESTDLLPVGWLNLKNRSLGSPVPAVGQLRTYAGANVTFPSSVQLVGALGTGTCEFIDAGNPFAVEEGRHFLVRHEFTGGGTFSLAIAWDEV